MEIIYQNKISSGQNLLIRYPLLDDVELMLKHINTLSAEKTFITFQGEQLTYEEERKYLQSYLKKIADKEAVKLMAFVNNELAGIADIEMQIRTDSHIGLFGITIAKNYRGKGIGTILMQLTLSEAINNLPDLKIIILSVFGNNEIAKTLYKKMGFLKYGILPQGVKYKDGFEDHIYMYKKVK